MVNSRPKAKTINILVPPTQSGLLTTVSTFGLLAPVTFTRNAGSSNANLAINESTGAITATTGLAINATQSIVGTVTGFDGCVIPFTYNLTGLFSLSALTLSASSATVGTSATINIVGATAGSTITGSPPDGMTLNGGARTITGTPTLAGSYVIALVETLAGSPNSPRTSNVNIVVAEAPTGEYPTTMTNTISYLGETFTLSQNMKVGYSLNGQPFIVTDTPGSWTVSTTPSAVVNGNVAHGAMFDPRLMGAVSGLSSALPQGFDEMLSKGTQGTGALGASGSTPWDAALNIDPAASGSYNLAGKVGRLVKSVRVTGGGLGEFCLLQKVLNINLVSTIPPAGAICPIFDGSGGVEWMTTGNVSKSIFAGDGYISGEETLASCITNDYLPGDTDWPMWIDSGERRRGLMPRRSWWASTGYSRDFGGVWAKLMNACHAEGAAAVSDAVFYRMLTVGSLCLENVRRGNVQRGGAGQNVGIKPMAVLAGMASRNTALYAESKLYEGNETHQAFWPTSAFSNIATTFPDNDGGGYYNRQPFLSEHYGRASYFHGEQDINAVSPAVDVSLYDSDLSPRYQFTSWASAGLGLSNCLRFVNGPSGKTGVNLILNDGPINSTNPYAATIPAMWRYTALNNNVDADLSAFATAAERTRTRQTIEAVVGSIPMTPDPVSVQKNQATYVTATPTGFDWNYVGYDIGGPIRSSTGLASITRVDHRLTLDGGRTFLVENNVGESGSKTTAVPYNRDIGVQNRRWSDDGAGPWSVNWAKVGPGGTVYPNSRLARFVIRPSGTPSGTPTNTQAPQILFKPLTNWAGPYYENATGLLPVNGIVYAGTGWWTGNLTGAATYKWYAGDLANGSDRVAIPSATSDSFTVTTAEGNKYLSLGVTIGGVEAFSTTYQVATPVYPSMTLTTFDGTNDYLSKNAVLPGVINGSKFTFSVTGALTASDGVVKNIARFGDAVGTGSTDSLIDIDRIASNAIRVIVRNTSGTELFRGTTVPNAWRTTNGEVTFSVSIDLDAGRYQVCVENSVIAWASAPVVTVEDIPFVSIIRPFILASLAGTNPVPINHRCTFFHTDSLDLSDSGNQNKLKPANIGNKGEGVFGVDARIMLYGPAATIGTNYGTGGNFTLVGSVEDAYDYTITNDAGWASIPAPLLSGGGLIGVAPGTYTAKTITATPSAPLIFRATTRATVWNATSLEWDAVSIGNRARVQSIALSGSSNIVLDGLELVSSSWTTPATNVVPCLSLVGTNAGFSVTRCYMHSGYRGAVDTPHNPTTIYPEYASIIPQFTGGVLTGFITSGNEFRNYIGNLTPDGQLNGTYPMTFNNISGVGTFEVGNFPTATFTVVDGYITARTIGQGGASDIANGTNGNWGALSKVVTWAGQQPMSSYLAFGIKDGVSANNTGTMTITDCLFEDLSNAVKGGVPKTGGAVNIIGNTFRRMYMDYISLGLSGNTVPPNTTVAWNVGTQPFSVIGDAGDPHSDFIQSYMNDLTLPYTPSNWNYDIYGNVFYDGNARGGVQGILLADCPTGIAYTGRVAGNIIASSNLSNGITLERASEAYVYRNTVVRYDPTNAVVNTGAVNIRMDDALTPTWTMLGNNIFEGTFLNNNATVYVDQVFRTNTTLGTRGASVSGGYGNVFVGGSAPVSLAQAISYFTPKGAYTANGLGTDGYLNFTTRTLDRTKEPVYAKMPIKINQALSTNINSDYTKILGGPDTGTISVSGGTATLSNSALGAGEGSASNSLSYTRGQYLKGIQTSSGSGSSVTTLNATFNGLALNRFDVITSVASAFVVADNEGTAYSTIATPPAEAGGLSKLLLGIRYRQDVAGTGNILANLTGGTFKLNAASTSSLRLLIGGSGHVFVRVPFSTASASTMRTYLIAIDLTKATIGEGGQIAVIDSVVQTIQSGGVHNPAAFSGSTFTLANLFSTTGMGVFAESDGGSKANGAIEWLWMHWVDANTALPDITDPLISAAFSADRFATNGSSNVFGAPKLFYRGASLAEWNSAVPNRGTVSSLPLTKLDGTYV